MKSKLIILLLALSIYGFGQGVIFMPYTPSGSTPAPLEAEGLWKLNNVLTDEKGNGDVTLTSGAIFTSGVKVEGTHGVNCDNAGRRITIPSKDYGNEATINFWFFKYGVSGTYHIFDRSSSSDGFEIILNQTSPTSCYFTFRTSNGTDVTNSSCTPFAMASGTWYQITVTYNKSAGTTQYMVNGVNRGTGVCRSDFSTSGTAVIGGNIEGTSDSYAYYDVPQVAKFQWTVAEALTAYGTPGIEITR